MRNYRHKPIVQEKGVMIRHHQDMGSLKSHRTQMNFVERMMELENHHFSTDTATIAGAAAYIHNGRNYQIQFKIRVNIDVNFFPSKFTDS